MFTLASASGNTFAYAWADEVPAAFDGARWARTLCPRGTALGLDGLFLLTRPESGLPWVLEHWDADGGHTFCSNGSRGALALPGAPEGPLVEAVSSGERVTLRREAQGFAIRMPSGPGFGFTPSPLDLPEPHVCGWIGNPQLVVEVPRAAAVDLARFAPPLRHHPGFPRGTNVNVLEIVAPGSALIRSWERGVEGETLCCGTGCAVAGAWLTRRTGLARWELTPTGGEKVTVEAELQADGSWRELWLSGDARVLGSFRPA
jgi:diaminopimelate epimerase